MNVEPRPTSLSTETVPPSIVLLTIGAVCGVSINALFTGGLLPALVLGVMLCAVVWRRYRHEDLSQVKRTPKLEVAKLFVIALPALFITPGPALAHLPLGLVFTQTGLTTALFLLLLFFFQKKEPQSADCLCHSGVSQYRRYNKNSALIGGLRL